MNNLRRKIIGVEIQNFNSKELKKCESDGIFSLSKFCVNYVEDIYQNTPNILRSTEYEYLLPLASVLVDNVYTDNSRYRESQQIEDQIRHKA